MSKDLRSPWQQIDYTTMFLLFLLFCVSIISIYSVEPNLPVHLRDHNFAAKQVVHYIIGLIVIFLAMIIDFDRFKQISWYLYGFGLFLLIVLKFAPEAIAPYSYGAKRAFNFPLIGTFMPSEFMKIFLIITLSAIISQHNEKYFEKTIREDFLLLGKIALTSVFPIFFIFRQPDLGTSLVFVSIVGSLIIVSGIRWRIIISMIASGLFIVTLLVFTYLHFPSFIINVFLGGEDYQIKRIYGWLEPYENVGQIGYQLVKSMTAIGSGQLSGKGLNENTVYLPEAHTDFIFAVIGEQFGFIGTSIVVAIFFMLIYRIIHTAIESNDPFGTYLCVGIVGMFTFQIFQNIGMTIGLLPITGIPLPFISYGGSSLLTSMLTIGIVLNVASRTRKYMFD